MQTAGKSISEHKILVGSSHSLLLKKEKEKRKEKERGKDEKTKEQIKEQKQVCWVPVTWCGWLSLGMQLGDAAG